LNHQPRKRFGQNFLTDKNIINNIVASIRPEPDDVMIEIGPGLGAMTIPLLDTVEVLNVIELDRDVIPVLMQNCASHHKDITRRLIINECDVLKFDFAAFHRQSNTDKKLRIVGNLPYNISTPILFHVLHYRDIIQDMHFMLQKEVVDRITATPGNKLYGRLSVMLQTFCDTAPLLQVPATAFRPQPKVQSAIIQLIPSERYASDISDFSAYETLVRTAFSQRRKTLKNTLRPLCTADQITAAGFDPGERAENLTVSDFVQLYAFLGSNDD
jgi:16S rRNA (adenine1518-N6/adenine1519-N6)-dimethyltransferase